MRQGTRAAGASLRLGLASLAIAALAVAAVAVAGCRNDRAASREPRPGMARCVYWAWPGLDVARYLSPAIPQTPRWGEFLDASRNHRVLIYDFLFLEGHPETVDPTWNDNVVPPVTGDDYLSYRSAGRWHVVHGHFSPNALGLYYVRLPEGARIDNAEAEAWRFPKGAELVQLLYRRKPGSGNEAAAELVEWRRMRNAGHEAGQMRSDGSRSDWIFESAIRDPGDGLWRRTREDGRDLQWTHLGPLGRRFDWPVVRPHTCAECHRLAGHSPFDGPRGAGDVYTLGDLREMVWAGQLDAVAPLLAQPPEETDIKRFADQVRPPDPRERYSLYIRLLAEQRAEVVAMVQAQQMLVDKSPFMEADVRARDQGKEIYQTQCAACHGIEARGRGPLALRTPAPPAIVGLKDKQILKTMRRGRETMPAWNTILPGDEQWRLILYLHSLR